jgi:hypothetical protein
MHPVLIGVGDLRTHRPEGTLSGVILHLRELRTTKRPLNRGEYPTMKTTHKLRLLAVALVAVLALTTAHAADITPAETKAIAEEGFIYGLPIVMNYGGHV